MSEIYQIWIFLDRHSDKCLVAALGRVIIQTVVDPGRLPGVI